MNMYPVKPFGQFDIKPAEILYKMPSYHGEEDNMGTKPSASKDSVIEPKISTRLEETLRESVFLTENLSKKVLDYINSHSSTTTSTSTEELPQGKPKKEKAGGAEKQKKQATPPKSENSVRPEEPHLLPIGVNDVHYRGQTVFHFKLQKYELVDQKLEVTAGKNYLEIVQLLRSIADERGVGKNIIIEEKAENGLTAVLTTSDTKQQKLDDAAKIFITLGEIAGVYTHHDRRLDQSHEWLAVADGVVSKNEPLDPVIRCMSQHLGALDLLNRTPGITLADLLLYVVVKSQPTLPNNVELFVKRIAEAVSTA